MRHFTHAAVTGGAGCLGSRLCEGLLAAGTRVTCLGNLLTGSLHNVAPLPQSQAFGLVTTDATGCIHVLGEVDLVLYFASPASPVDCPRLPIETMKVGSLGTLAYRTTHGTDTAIVQIFTTYGPRMRADDGCAISAFLHQALTGQPLTVAGDGRQTRSVWHVDDTVRAVLMVAASGMSGPVDIGCLEEVTVLDLATSILADTGSSSPVTFIERPVDDPRVRRPDISLVRRELGWQPEVSWREGLAFTPAALTAAAA